jgi:predicted tellurium resistance membrane protein TerC
MKKVYNWGNALVIALTFVLFTIALFVTGFTKGLLLEAGVLLVSVKIILMNIKNSNSNKIILNKLDELDEKLKEIQNQKSS